ncbi:hypothetical protein SAMN02745823_03394 [Sporobacter termitidis DSM 10068]|uniref:4Fe-4S ferredoxin-type domain-containing protein n=1 Tax=Sporobacter termitidis DSM 10068 TaxID=1123282 RepID=A0A1M5Z902_9FIRM|nr:aldo/keto reductase [Sporobacter termitidis]SHI20697.1 hypothetical protein SAMN02745823_03394 [Sporobacter termitidis DSM 10068]
MLYREMGKTGDRVSILGYGCMRFPKDGNKIDEARAGKQVISAIERGVNYFDTAYLYRGSEATLGNILSGGYRDKVMIATKMPPMNINSRRDMDKVLEMQLERLKTDRIDYYLVHMLGTMEGWQRLKQLGIEDFFDKARQSGKIRRVAFSFHGGREQFIKIVDDYPWDMAQIQYNYVDEHNQAGREGLEHAAAKGIGISVMEPLRGGFLVNKLPRQVQAVWDGAEAKRTPAEWALRWVWNHPGVSLLLSGMNEEAQLDENIRLAGEVLPNSLTGDDMKVYETVRDILTKTVKVGCTGCSYCMPCPAGVNIPYCFSAYNDRYIYDDRKQRMFYMGVTAGVDGGGRAYASLCKNCGACEKKCPQSLPIRSLLKDVSKEMEPFYFRPLSGLIQGYLKARGGPGKKANG